MSLGIMSILRFARQHTLLTIEWRNCENKHTFSHLSVCPVELCPLMAVEMYGKLIYESERVCVVFLSHKHIFLLLPLPQEHTESSRGVDG